MHNKEIPLLLPGQSQDAEGGAGAGLRSCRNFSNYHKLYHWENLLDLIPEAQHQHVITFHVQKAHFVVFTGFGCFNSDFDVLLFTHTYICRSRPSVQC